MSLAWKIVGVIGLIVVSTLLAQYGAYQLHLWSVEKAVKELDLEFPLK